MWVSSTSNEWPHCCGEVNVRSNAQNHAACGRPQNESVPGQMLWGLCAGNSNICSRISNGSHSHEDTRASGNARPLDVYWARFQVRVDLTVEVANIWNVDTHLPDYIAQHPRDATEFPFLGTYSNLLCTYQYRGCHYLYCCHRHDQCCQWQVQIIRYI
jgi:hypothetical protein